MMIQMRNIFPEYIQELEKMCTSEPTKESANRLADMGMVHSKISHECGDEAGAYHNLACARFIKLLLRQVEDLKKFTS